jgi:hypothetical protein
VLITASETPPAATVATMTAVIPHGFRIAHHSFHKHTREKVTVGNWSAASEIQLSSYLNGPSNPGWRPNHPLVDQPIRSQDVAEM